MSHSGDSRWCADGAQASPSPLPTASLVARHPDRTGQRMTRCRYLRRGLRRGIVAVQVAREGLERRLVEGLLLEQIAGAALEHLAVGPEDVDRALEDALDDGADRDVDLARRLLAVACARR